MAILDRIFGIEQRNTLVVTGAGVGQDSTLNRVFGDSGATAAGISVTEEKAQTISAVYRAVTLIAGTIASLPKFLYERVGDSGDKEPARTHPLFALLHRRPNPVMSPFFYNQLRLAYTLLWGRSYAYIERRGRGSVTALWPMKTCEVKRERLNGSLIYDVTRVKDNDLFPRPPFTNPRMLFASEVLELSTFDGESIISHAREQLGETIAAQQHGSGFYAGGAQPYIAVKHPGRIKDPARFRENWEKVHSGSKRKIAVLEEGAEVQEIGMPLKDAQFLESRKFYVTEIARWFGVPPHKLMDLERATFSNIEEQQLEWYEGLLPWLVMIEQEEERMLLQNNEADSYFIEHNVDGLLRGNIQQRYAAYSQGIQWGFLNRNEVRRRENLNSMGEEGNVFLVPGNMTTADNAGAQISALAATDATSTQPADGSSQMRVATTALGESIRRMLTKEVADIREAAKRPEKFLDWLDGFRAKWPAKWHTGLRPAVAACHSLGIEGDTSAIDLHCRSAADGLLELAGKATPANLLSAVLAETETWTHDIPKLLTASILGEKHAPADAQ